MANIVYMARSAWTGLLDTIRSKAGITGSMTVSQAADAVDSIETGGGDDELDQLIEGTLSKITTNVSTIAPYALDYRSNLLSVTGLNVESIGESAFYRCIQLNTINFPNLVSISRYAFASCSALGAIQFSRVSSVTSSVFQECRGLTHISLPIVETIGDGAFSGCKTLSEVSFPSLSFTSSCTFGFCTALEKFEAPLLKRVGRFCFSECSALKSVNFPNLTTISSSAFYRCYRLLSVYLMASSVVSLDAYPPFKSTPIDGYTDYTGGVYGSIFVPASLYDAYLSNTRWATYSSRIVSVAD